MTPAGEALLSSAGELFYERGIHSVGVDTIAAHAGTTKKTLYDRFGSKDGLITVYLQRRSERWKTFVRDYVDAQPAERRGPLAVLDALATWMEGTTRGCGFINAFAELAGTKSGGLDVIRAEKRWLRELYLELCGDAGLAAELTLIHEGAIVQSTAGDDSEALARARALAERMMPHPNRG